VKVVLDTNVFIDATADDYSAQAKLINAILANEIVAVTTKPVQREYRKILRRLVKEEAERDHFNQVIAATQVVKPAQTDVIVDDLDDLKFIQAAIGGRATLIVTNDRHLLDVGEINDIKIVTPTEAWARFEEENGTSSEWTEWTRGLGINK